MKNSKTKKPAKDVVTVKEETPVETVAPNTVEIVTEYVSKDGKLKSVVRVNAVRQNRSSSIYEVDFYKANNVIATESYAFHTLRYHEEAAENYVNGIKKLHENEVLQLQEDIQQKNLPKSNTRVS